MNALTARKLNGYAEPIIGEGGKDAGVLFVGTVVFRLKKSVHDITSNSLDIEGDGDDYRFAGIRLVRINVLALVPC